MADSARDLPGGILKRSGYVRAERISFAWQAERENEQNNAETESRPGMGAV